VSARLRLAALSLAASSAAPAALLAPAAVTASAKPDTFLGVCIAHCKGDHTAYRAPAGGCGFFDVCNAPLETYSKPSLPKRGPTKIYEMPKSHKAASGGDWAPGWTCAICPPQ